MVNTRKSPEPEKANFYSTSSSPLRPPLRVRSFQHVPRYLPRAHFLCPPLRSNMAKIYRAHFQTSFVASSRPRVLLYVGVKFVMKTRLPDASTGDAYGLLGCTRALVTQEAADILCSSAAALTLARTTSCAQVRAARRWRLRMLTPCAGEAFPTNLRVQLGTGM